MELLERETQIATLNAALADVSGGSGRIALISGEAGIGKTSLLEMFIQRKHPPARVFWGACDALFTPRPLGPLYDMAEQIDSNILELLATESSQVQLFSTVLAELKKEPTIAVFEDVHWADEATLDLLRYLGRRITQTSTFLVMTYQDVGLGLRHPLLTVLGDIGSSNTTQRIPLSPLSQQAVNILAKDRDIDVTALHHQTGGNPFYITEVLASKSEGIPASIRDAVLARTSQLSLSGFAVLEAAAVIGLRIEPWLLEITVGSEIGAVDESIQAGILISQGDALAFRHDLTRQTILEVISPQRKPVLHRLVLDALESSPITRKDLTRLAHHAKGSGDYQAVLEYAPAAARQAALAGAHREAATLFGLVLSYAEHLDMMEYASILQEYARECNVAEKQSEAIAAQRKAAEIWNQLQKPTKQAETLSVLAIMLRNHGKNTEAERVNRSALEMLEAIPPGREQALTFRVQATLCLSRRDCAEAIDWGEKAIALAGKFGDENNLAMAHVAIGSARMFLDYKQGRKYLEKRLQIAKNSGEERHIANLYAYITASSVELYRFREAEKYLDEGITYTAERGLDIFNRYMLAWQVLTYIHLGRWKEASEVSNQLTQNPAYPAISRITALAATGRLRSRRGDPGYEAVLNEALEIATQTGTLQYLGMVRAVKAEVAWMSGDHKGTLVEARSVYDLAVSKQHPWLVGELAYWRWKAGEKIQPPEWLARPYALQIKGNWQAAATAWEGMGCPYEQARALAEGDIEAQVAALKIFERLGAAPAAEETRQKLRNMGEMNIPRLPRSSTIQNPFGLTNRQLDVLALLIEDLSNAEIAARLHISPKTVDHHVSAILAKLDVHSRDEAATQARHHLHFEKNREYPKQI